MAHVVANAATKAKQARHKVLIERLQAEARQAPNGYRMRVGLLALLGYAVLVTILLLALGLPLGLVIALWRGGHGFDPMLLYVLIPQLLFAALVVRALWLRFEAPRGYALAANEAPELWAEVERLRLAAAAPPLADIVIDDELNAGAASMPRWLGLLGYRHYLVIGLPLMRTLDRAELAAVIAHEFGHFGGGHGRFSGWIYRVRLSWYRLLEAFARGNSLFAQLFYKFFDWYVPYFNAYSFVLAREDEYSADAVSARVAGEAARVSALVRVEHAAQCLQSRFWPKMAVRMRAQPQPPPQLQTSLAAFLRELPVIDIDRLLASAERENDIDDTHPTLPQRINAVGAVVALKAQMSDATVLLGDLVPKIERRLDVAWREQIASEWAARYAAAANERRRLDDLERHSELNPDEMLQHAQLVESLRPDIDAIRVYDRVLALTPHNANALFRAGVLRIERGDAAGVTMLRDAMQRDPGAIRPAVERLEAIAKDATIPTAVAAEAARLHAEFASSALSLQARDGVDDDDELIAHDLDPAALGRLQAMLARIEQVTQAWLVRKRFDFADEPAHYTLMVTWRGSVASETAGLQRIVATWKLPGSVSVFSDSGHKALARQIRVLCRDPVYRKGTSR
jgi:Zn-dependent protease with chaperone function